MIPITYYDYLTGQITGQGQVQQSVLAALALEEGTAAIAGSFNADTHYIFEGRAKPRLIMPDIQITASGLRFVSMPPAGTQIEVTSELYNVTTPVTNVEVNLALDGFATIKVTPPWPYMSFEAGVDFVSNPDATGQIISPDLGFVKGYYSDALYLKADQMVHTLLGSPSDSTRRRWLIKRALYDKHISGNLSAADDAALNADVRYSGKSVADHLLEIDSKINRENIITLLADGLREEGLYRINAAVSVAQIIEAVAWATAESEAAAGEVANGT